MNRNLTKKTVQLLIILGIFIAPLSMQALFAVEIPQNSVFNTEISKNKAHLPASIMSEDVVIDDLVMFDVFARGLSSSTCGWGAPTTHGSGNAIDVVLVNGSTWTANFTKGNTNLTVKLNYDAQSDIMGFRKTLSRGMTYTIAPNGESILFYVNSKPYIELDNIQNCDQNVCFTVRFLINKISMSLYGCTTSASTYSVTAQNSNNNAQIQAKTSVAFDGEEGIRVTDLKKMNVVSGHQAVPNPINNQTYIQYYLTDDAPVRVAIYNAIGQQIKVLVNQNQTRGAQSIEWNIGDELKGGMYFYEITVQNERMIGKVIKL